MSCTDDTRGRTDGTGSAGNSPGARSTTRSTAACSWWQCVIPLR